MFSKEALLQLPYLIGALIPALTFHEWGHAMMATKMGDMTPRMAGRLTLNPLAHMDPLGTIAIFLIHFGWGKPVPINVNNLKSSWGEFWVAFAGPGMNLILATFFAILLRLGIPERVGEPYEHILSNLFEISVVLNLALAFFNLIPFGPLDGAPILARLLPKTAGIRFTNWNAMYGGTILFVVVLFDIFTRAGILSAIIQVPTAVATTLLLGT